MDLATIIGIVLGFGLIVGAILLDGSLMAFMNLPGALVVIGGTIAATLIKQKLRSVLAAFSVAKQAFLFRLPPSRSSSASSTSSASSPARTAYSPWRRSR